MRNLIAIVSMAALAVAGTAAAGDNKKRDKQDKVARAMAVAEIDFELQRAQLGLVGSSLVNPDAKVERAMALAEIDFELHRAQLGLVGSSLLSERRELGEAPKSRAEQPAYLIASPAEPVAATPAAVSDPRQ